MNQVLSKSITRIAAGCLLGALSAHYAAAQSNIVNQINAAMFQGYHQNLAVAPGDNRGFTKKANPLITRTPVATHNIVRDYIFSTFSSLGLAAKLDTFSFTTDFGGPSYEYAGCNNIIAMIPGKNPATYGYYIVGANYDSLDAGQPNPVNLTQVAPRSPGADMNASGVAALLCLANVLRTNEFLSTIVFVAFDASQKNYGGPTRFVKHDTTVTAGATNRILRSSIKGMISIDTIGFNKKNGGYLDTVLLYGGNPVVGKLRNKLGGALIRYGGLTVLQGGSIESSDHVPFWEAGIDSCSLHEGGVWVNRNIYTTNDTASVAGYIDYAYAAKITRGVAGFLCERAGLQP
jgi:hypothetical protein